MDALPRMLPRRQDVGPRVGVGAAQPRRIVVLRRDGTVEAQGSHAELLARPGWSDRMREWGMETSWRSAQAVLDLVQFQYGDALAARGQYDSAAGRFRAVIALPGANSELVTRSHLRSAQMLDLLRRRDEAIVEYRAVLARDNVFDSHDQAEKYLKKPYGELDEK